MLMDLIEGFSLKDAERVKVRERGEKKGEQRSGRRGREMERGERRGG